MSSLGIIYSCIARLSTSPIILCEHSNASGNFISVSRHLLAKLPSGQSDSEKMSYSYERHFFHYMRVGDLVILALADGNFPRRIAFAFLKDIHDRFKDEYGGNWQTGMAFEFNEFSRVLSRQAEFFSHDERADKLSAMKVKLDETKDIMVRNIDSLLDRGEKLEDIVQKTEMMQTDSFQFQKSSKTLKWTMIRKNIILLCVILLIIFVAIVLIVWIGCGLTFQRCGNTPDDDKHHGKK